MASNLQIADEAANAAMDALGALCNSGKLRIYEGTQPADGDTGIGASTLLAELTMNATAFGAASNGVITANAITADSAANATGTAQWFRIWKSNGTDEVVDGTVGTSGCDLNMNSTAIQENAAVSVTSLTLTMPQAPA